MANPYYGEQFDATLPTPAINAAAEVSSQYAAGSPVKVTTAGGVALHFAAINYYGQEKMRFAWQRRERYSASDPNWGGGDTWTDWHNGSNVVGAWEEMYSAFTLDDTLAPTYVDAVNIDHVAYLVTNQTVHTYNYVTTTYDAYEYRVQAWHIAPGGSPHTWRYGSPDTKTFRVDFAPTFTATVITSSALNRTEIALAVNGWARGASLYRLYSVGYAPSGATNGYNLTNASGVFDLGFLPQIGDTTASITAQVRANGSNVAQSYTVSESIQFLSPDGAVTKPVVAVSTDDGELGFSVTDASYERVTISCEWTGGSEIIEPTLDGGVWTATVLPPLNTEVAWNVSGYKTVLGVEAFNSTEGTATLAGYGYELRADDGSTLTMTLEAKEQMTVDVDSAAITLASGRTVARHGLGNKRTWTLRGQLLGSSHSATSDWIDALAILNLPQNLTYRNPYGEVARVCVTSWTRNPASIWDVLDISVSFTEVE